MYLTHGQTKTPEYLVWRNILNRCGNPKDPGYARYGGRGISVCDQWLSFEAFIADMGHRPSPKHSIDRIDNNGNYAPGNVRWATKREQQQNLRSNRRVEIGGESVCVNELARRSGVPKSTMQGRIARGLAPERAIVQAVKRPDSMRGVYFVKRTGKWQVIVQIKGVRHHLGSFSSPDEASRVVWQSSKKNK